MDIEASSETYWHFYSGDVRAGTGSGLTLLSTGNLEPGGHVTFGFLGVFNPLTCTLGGALTNFDAHIQDSVNWIYDDGMLAGPAANVINGDIFPFPGRQELEFVR